MWARGQRRDEQFFDDLQSGDGPTASRCAIGVNGGSLNQELVMRKMQEKHGPEPGGKEKRRDYKRLHGAFGAAINGAGVGERSAPRPDYYFVQDFAGRGI